MAFKFVTFVTLLVAANAGLIPYDNHQASHAVSYSSVSHAPVEGHEHSSLHGYAAPALHSYSAPAVHSYAAPAIHSYAAPAVHSYAAPAVHSYAAPAVHSVVAPVVHKVAVAPFVSKVAVAAPLVHKVVAPVAYHQQEEQEHYAPAHYQFEYGVQDLHTHDIKEQKEVREGDVVKGMYSLVEPDGSKRVVEYTADHHNGFNAVVHREHSTHPAPSKIVAPVAKVAFAPIAKVAVAAPVQYHHYH